MIRLPRYCLRRSSSAAADHDPLRLPANTGLRRLPLVPHKDPPIALLDRPAGKRVESWRAQSLPGAQVEAGVVPRTAHCVVDHEAIDQRTVIVLAMSADRKHLGSTTYQQHFFIAHMAHELTAIGQIGQRHSLYQIGTRRRRMVSRGHLPNPL